MCSFLLLLYKTSHQHATQRMAGCLGASGMVRSDPRPTSPFLCNGLAQHREFSSASVKLSIPHAIRGVVLQRLRLRNQLRCKFHENLRRESSCVLGRVRRDCSRSLGRFSEASPVPGGNSPGARPHEVVRGVCASCLEIDLMRWRRQPIRPVPAPPTQQGRSK